MRKKLKSLLKYIGLVFVSWWFFFSLPKDLFDVPYSTLLTDSEGQLLSARIADDGQWRFPNTDHPPSKYEIALLSFEDRYFYYHPGINPLAIGRAMYQNVKEKRLVSGGSTLSMQVIRMSRNRSGQAISQKIIESFLTLRLELKYSKKEIIRLHTANAPYGGNVVGLEAATWRYYGRSPSTLSWAEAATLAVLPNAPNLIHPGKNRGLLKAKRNRLLKRLLDYEKIDSADYQLALLEKLPHKPHALPQGARHLLDYAIVHGQKGQRIPTTIQNSVQQKANQVIQDHYDRLSQNEIFNACAIILDVKTNQVISYIGNTPTTSLHSADVDITRAHRSTGSILKPFLYAASMQDGMILPKTLVPDIPTEIGGYIPINYHREYDGAVPANEALSRSLNIPAVRMLRDYGIHNFYSKLKKLDINSLHQSPGHYGLSLILGGAETNLWDLANAYKNMARTLNNFDDHPHEYYAQDWTTSNFINKKNKINNHKIIPPFNAGAIYLTFDALTGVKRPHSEKGWEYFKSSRKVAWKTGTSHGFRDAWAVGVTPEYVVAVWVGNADGLGRPDLVGVKAAAPVLFDLFDILPATSWFQAPYDELRQIDVCRTSGYIANSTCVDVEQMWVHKHGLKTAACPYHEMIHVDQNLEYQVNSDCYPIEDMRTEVTFELPATQAWYYRQKHQDYTSPPPYLPGCHSSTQRKMEIVYPHQDSHITIPKHIDGQQGKSVFKVAHTQPEAEIYWYIDDRYIGSTTGHHNMEISPKAGPHILTVTDHSGYRIKHGFEVVL